MLNALALSLVALSAAPRFIEDDYPRALAAAKASKKLLFVDAWAPWCHTCIFMREHVLTRPAFGAFEKDLLFASIDTELPKNAAFVEKFPVDMWPTLFFIDPATEQVVFKWLGSADEAQMTALLEAARGADATWSGADHLLAGGDAKTAAQRYLAAVKSGGAASSARVTLSLLSALSVAQQHEACAKATVEQLASLTTAADRVNGLGWGLWCALALPASTERAALVTKLVAEARTVLTADDVLADDRSGLYEVLVTERQDAKDGVAAEALALEWLAFLEKEAAKATTPAARMVFDPHRVGAALAAKRPERVVDALARSEAERPKDYNPPARLAVVYRELGRLDDALAAAERALRNCAAGPRKLRLYETKASVLERRGDLAGRRRTLEEAVTYAKQLPKAQRSAARLADLERQARDAATP
jgi:tetratricopeptide (TPR) repeat protein/thiol-disulfide isomerase/thioredoxin